MRTRRKTTTENHESCLIQTEQRPWENRRNHKAKHQKSASTNESQQTVQKIATSNPPISLIHTGPKSKDYVFKRGARRTITPVHRLEPDEQAEGEGGGWFQSQ